MIHRLGQSLIPIKLDYTYVLEEIESVSEQVEIADIQTQICGTLVNSALDRTTQLKLELNQEKL